MTCSTSDYSEKGSGCWSSARLAWHEEGQGKNIRKLCSAQGMRLGPALPLVNALHSSTYSSAPATGRPSGAKKRAVFVFQRALWGKTAQTRQGLTCTDKRFVWTGPLPSQPSPGGRQTGCSIHEPEPNERHEFSFIRVI